MDKINENNLNQETLNKEEFEKVFAAAAERSGMAELARKNQFAENLEAMMCELRDKLNSFPAEQPSEDLKEAAEEYSGKASHPLNNAFIAGAQWQKEQMMKSAIDGCHITRNPMENYSIKPQTGNYWIIQTAETHKDIQKHRHRRGLDKYWDFHNIADVEFDIDTLYSSRSLARIRDGLVLEANKLNFEHPDSVYMLSNKIIRGVQFTILSKKGTEDEIAEIIHQIGEGHFKVKYGQRDCSPSLSNLCFVLKYIPYSPRYPKTNFWWDVENDWMAFLSGDNNINVSRFLEAMAEGQKARNTILSNTL